MEGTLDREAEEAEEVGEVQLRTCQLGRKEVGQTRRPRGNSHTVTHPIKIGKFCSGLLPSKLGGCKQFHLNQTY